MAALNKEDALADAKAGMAINDIALKQGVTYQAVWRWLKTQTFTVTPGPEENGEEDPDIDEDDSGEDLQISGSTHTKKHNVAISHLIRCRCPKCNGKLERTRIRIRDEMGDITGIIYQCQDCEACFDV